MRRPHSSGYGVRGTALSSDMMDREQCRAHVRETVQQHGRLDILVSNATYQMEQHGIEDITPDQLERTFRSNIFA